MVSTDTRAHRKTSSRVTYPEVKRGKPKRRQGSSFAGLYLFLLDKKPVTKLLSILISMVDTSRQGTPGVVVDSRGKVCEHLFEEVLGTYVENVLTIFVTSQYERCSTKTTLVVRC